MRIFSTTKSPGFGSSPPTGAAPQLPRTSALVSTPSKSGALSVRPGAPGSTDEPDVDHDNAARARDVREPADIVDDALLRGAWAGAPGIGEGAAVHDDVVLQVLDDQGAALRIELHVAIGRSARSPWTGSAAPPPALI